jgi:tetratricopeptide (TPR) repeat protein
MNEEHPEEWLDLAAGGRLMPQERALLDRHVASCLACAAQLKIVASSGSEGLPGSADPTLDRWAVERAVAALASRPSTRWWGQWWRASPRLGWLFAAVVLFLATGVSAKLWIARESAPARLEQAQPAAAARPQRRPPVAHLGAAEPGFERIESPETVLDETEKPPERSRSRRPHQPTAAELFDRARELGQQGKLDAALSIHLRLQRLFPDSAEAGLASALAGRLLLDRDRPAEALVQFDRHLARGGAADEEALAGRAVSLERLGRHVEEKIAWRALLDRHSGSVYADRARGRLRVLSVP